MPYCFCVPLNSICHQSIGREASLNITSHDVQSNSNFFCYSALYNFGVKCVEYVLLSFKSHWSIYQSHIFSIAIKMMTAQICFRLNFRRKNVNNCIYRCGNITGQCLCCCHSSDYWRIDYGVLAGAFRNHCIYLQYFHKLKICFVDNLMEID